MTCGAADAGTEEQPSAHHPCHVKRAQPGQPLRAHAHAQPASAARQPAARLLPRAQALTGAGPCRRERAVAAPLKRNPRPGSAFDAARLHALVRDSAHHTTARLARARAESPTPRLRHRDRDRTARLPPASGSSITPRRRTREIPLALPRPGAARPLQRAAPAARAPWSPRWRDRPAAPADSLLLVARLRRLALDLNPLTRRRASSLRRRFHAPTVSFSSAALLLL